MKYGRGACAQRGQRNGILAFVQRETVQDLTAELAEKTSIRRSCYSSFAAWLSPFELDVISLRKLPQFRASWHSFSRLLSGVSQLSTLWDPHTHCFSLIPLTRSLRLPSTHGMLKLEVVLILSNVILLCFALAFIRIYARRICPAFEYTIQFLILLRANERFFELNSRVKVNTLTAMRILVVLWVAYWFVTKIRRSNCLSNS